MSLHDFSFISLGLILGIRHAFDPDHLAAVSTIVTEGGGLKHAARVGLLWGLGHTATLLVAGVAALLFSLSISAWMSTAMETVVGFMLIGLGLRALLARREAHGHTHEQGSDHHHSHAGPGFGSGGISLRPLAIGVVHGLAGSGALTFLVLTRAPSLSVGVIYILLFGVGTMVAMVGVSVGLALPFTFGRWSVTGPFRHLSRVAGVVSVLLGLTMVGEMGYSLLTSIQVL